VTRFVCQGSRLRPTDHSASAGGPGQPAGDSCAVESLDVQERK